jgi:hypothetical protein
MSRARILLCAALAACLLFQGCSAFGRATRAPCNAVAALDYADRIPGLTAAELESEHQTTQKAFAEKGRPCDRFRLVFQLLAPEAKFRDEARAVKLLGEYLETTPASDGGFRPLAKLLVANIRRQWELEGRARDLGRRVADEKARADALNRQLDELKEIERILNERQKR